MLIPLSEVMRNKKRKKKGKENWHLQRPSSIQAGTWLKIIGRLFQIFQTKYFRYRFHHSFLDFLNFLSKRRNRLVEARKTARETERNRKRERESYRHAYGSNAKLIIRRFLCLVIAHRHVFITRPGPRTSDGIVVSRTG